MHDKKKVELPIRDVAVNNFKLISYEGNKAKFIATVSKGTYIRSLIVDLAKSIGTKAGYLQLIELKLEL